ncbi:Transporter, MFS superfamily protein [Geobacillus sp. WSUCF1]|nr:Transporter, MFS superfamily protein [Geobacillus sp. WSUCF1]
MAFFQKLTGQEQVNRDLLLLLCIGGVYALGVSLSNTFVNIYLWKQTGDFRDLALYNLAIVTMQPLTFIFAGRMAKQIDRILVLRLGVSCLAVFFCHGFAGRLSRPSIFAFSRCAARRRLWFLLAGI